MLLTYNALKSAVSLHADNDKVENTTIRYDINCTRLNPNFWLLTVSASGKLSFTTTQKLSNMTLVKRLNKIAQTVKGGFDIMISVMPENVEVKTRDQLEIVNLHIE